VPEIAAFRGLRYNPSRFGPDLSAVVAPPYDVLSAEDKADLLARSELNIVAVDLPHVPPKAAGPDAEYDQAAGLLSQWRSGEVLARDDRPAFYIYHQVYTHGDQQFTRKMFLARMRLETFGAGTVFPHEQTFSGPKADRLKLMQTTRCQLSPIFGLYGDTNNTISSLLDVGDIKPDTLATLQGTENRLWVLQEPERLDAVRECFDNRAVYIADGHHRYGTALTYRDQLNGEGHALPPDHPAQFVLIGLCAMEDPGCIILPTHRVLSGFGDVKPGQILNALQAGLEMTTADPNLSDPEQILPADSPNDLAVYVAAGDRMYTGTFTRRDIMETLAPDESPAWRNLDLAYLHRYLIEELVTKEALAGKPPRVDCIKAGAPLLDITRRVNGIALICKPCTMADLREVSNAGGLMPQKSTFFHPKLATGLVINLLE
jgi:uncharacterized protein (DUF1015 family)